MKMILLLPFLMMTTLWARSVDLSSYPLYPLREDLGEQMIEKERESVKRTADSVEVLIRKREIEEEFKGRGDHGKSHGCYPSSLKILPDLREEYAAGVAKKENQGKAFFSILRFSNSDTPKTSDKRSASQGMALKVFLNTESPDQFFQTGSVPSQKNQTQDFLSSSSKTFMLSNIVDYSRLFEWRSQGKNLRIIWNYTNIAWNRKVAPLFRNRQDAPILLEKTLWSELPFAWGNRAAKYRFTPCHDFGRGDLPRGFAKNSNYQRDSIEEFLSREDICYTLEVQLRPLTPSRERRFPLEDATVFWRTNEAPYLAVARLVVPKDQVSLTKEECETLSFNPWNALKDHQPLGNLNRARLPVYKQSALTRKELYGGRIFYDGRKELFLKYATDKLTLGLIPKMSEYGKLVLQLSEERNVMMLGNLFGVGVDKDGDIDCNYVMDTPHRTADGTCYFHNVANVDLDELENIAYSGATNARFGRNLLPLYGENDLLTPNPRLISQKLFTRKDGMIPAETLNLLAAAWIQGQIHDWFSHGKNVQVRPPMALTEEKAKMFDAVIIPPISGDGDFPYGMMFPRTRPDLTDLSSNGFSPTFRNTVTHWWDASQIYGSDEETILKVRTNPHTGELLPQGRIAVDEENRRLYYGEDGRPITGFSDNWWIGLELFHSLFAMEHNAVVDSLIENYPDMADKELFDVARLVVSALIAQIHTIEWTPALLDNPALHIAMRANWSGLKESLPMLGSGPVKFLLNRVFRKNAQRYQQAIHGLTKEGSLYLYNVPFSLTEEFVSVYRMHPLIPDYFHLYSAEGEAEGRTTINETRDEKARDLSYQSPSSTLKLMYTLGLDHPGALVLHNYPRFMQNITVRGNTEGMSEVTFDLAALDVFRDRERLGGLRYNTFREQLHLPPIKSFSDLTSNADDVVLLEEIYGGDVSKLDLVVGSLAEEDRYENFAFGNTAFYIFALMASRRLMADPFFSNYFTPEVYTPVGYEWVQTQSMTDVILRHYPELEGAFEGVINAFHPWEKIFELGADERRLEEKYNPEYRGTDTR